MLSFPPPLGGESGWGRKRQTEKKQKDSTRDCVRHSERAAPSSINQAMTQVIDFKEK